MRSVISAVAAGDIAALLVQGFFRPGRAHAQLLPVAGRLLHVRQPDSTERVFEFDQNL
jgi:hypothetical protein